MDRSISFLLVLAGAAAAPTARAAVAPAPGFAAAAHALGGGSSFIGGLAWLPNGHLALFDGGAVVELDPATGATLATLYTPATFVFGSFLALEPGGAALVFGESSFGTITRIPLGGGAPALLATLAFHFDAAFGPDGGCYVAASPSLSDNDVYRVDLASGGADLIARIPGPSGPLAFDAAGDLYLGESSFSFPAPVGMQRIYRFAAAAVLGAVGPTHLGVAQASVFAAGQSAPFDLAFDEEGDLLVSDVVDGELREYGPTGLPKGVIAAEVAGAAPTFIAFRGNGATSPAAFGAFQRDDGGELACISSDFATFDDLALVRPRRAALAVAPASPVPVGPFTLELTHGPPSGLAFLFASAGVLVPEQVVHYGATPLLFGLAPLGLTAGTLLPLGAAGTLSIPIDNPGLGASLGAQAFVISALGVPLSTTSALALTLQ